jgi:hypothetical protein
LLTQYHSRDQIEKYEMGWTCGTYGEQERCIQDLVVGPEGRRPLGVTSHRWDVKVKIKLQEVGCGGMDCIAVGQGRNRWRALLIALMNYRLV